LGECAAAFVDKMHKILDTTGAYSSFVSARYYRRVLQKEFDRPMFETATIPDVPTIEASLQS
jgi:hypothetical protein